MKCFVFLYKLKLKEKNQDCNLFCFCIYNTYIYLGTSNGKIIIFKKENLFQKPYYFKTFSINSKDIITKIYVLNEFKFLIIGTNNGKILLLKNNIILKENYKNNKKNIIFLIKNDIHKNAISVINYFIKNDFLYLFIGDIDGILSCFILKKGKIWILKKSLIIVNKYLGLISYVEINLKNNLILISGNKCNIIIKINDLFEKNIDFKNIGKKESNNYKSIFLKKKKNYSKILTLRKNGRMWISNNENVTNTLVFYYSFFYFFYILFNILNKNNNNENNINNNIDKNNVNGNINEINIFNYYKKKFLNNNYFINLIEIILKKFDKFSISFKPDLNVCYKIDKFFFIVLKQINPFIFLKNKYKKENTNKKNENIDNEINLNNDLEYIKSYIKNKIEEEEEENEEKKKCLLFIQNHLNNDKEIFEKLKSNKIFLYNIKNIQIEEIIELNVYSNSLNKNVNSYYTSDKYQKENEKSMNDIKNITNNSINKIVHNDNIQNNVEKDFNLINKKKHDEQLFDIYFKDDKIIDSYFINKKLYLLYYNDHLKNDFYFALNLNNSILTQFHFNDISIHKKNINKKYYYDKENMKSFYLCEVITLEISKLLKYITVLIQKKMNKFTLNTFYYFFFYINVFYEYLQETKKNYDINVFYILEKEFIKININNIEKAFDLILYNIQKIQIKIKNIISQTKKKTNVLLIDKNNIYEQFDNENLFLIDYQYFQLNFKKIRKLYLKMKKIIIIYKYFFYKIILTFVFSNEEIKENQNEIKHCKDDIFAIFINIIKNDFYLLFKILYIFYLYLLLEYIISNNIHTNNICLTNFPTNFINNKKKYINHKNIIDYSFYFENIEINNFLKNKTKFHHKLHNNILYIKFIYSNKNTIKLYKNNQKTNNFMEYLDYVNNIYIKNNIFEILLFKPFFFMNNIRIVIIKKKYIYLLNIFNILNYIKYRKFFYYKSNKFIKSEYYKIILFLLIILKNYKNKKIFKFKLNNKLYLKNWNKNEEKYLYKKIKIFLNNIYDKKMSNMFNNCIKSYEGNEQKNNKLYIIKTMDHENVINMTNILDIIRITSVLKNVYKNKLNKMTIKNICYFFKIAKKFYFYEYIIEDVYITKLNNYNEIYKYFLIYEIIFKFFNMNINLFVLLQKHKINNIKYNLIKSFLFYSYKEQMQNYVYENCLYLMTNKKINYFEKINKYIEEKNILLLDIMLNIFYLLFFNNSVKKIEIENIFKKFSSFNYLCDYIYFLKNEQIKDNENKIEFKNKNVLLFSYTKEIINEKDNYNNFIENYNKHFILQNKYTKEKTTIKKNIKIYLKKPFNNFKKIKKKYISNNNIIKKSIYLNKKIKDFKTQNNCFKHYNEKTFKNTSNKYLKILNIKLNEYAYISDNIKYTRNISMKKKYEKQNLFILLNIFYIFCKITYNYNLYLKIYNKKIKNYIYFKDYVNILNKKKKNYINDFINISNKINNLNVINEIYTNKAHFYIKLNKIKKYKIYKKILNEWNYNKAINFLTYIQKNIKEKKINKYFFFLIFKICKLLVLLNWKNIIYILLNIFKKKKRKYFYFY